LLGEPFSSEDTTVNLFQCITTQLEPEDRGNSIS
jgi:hypothetical protein